MKILAGQSLRFILIGAISLFTVACGTTKMSSSKESEAAKMMTAMEVYEVHHDGRIHIFYDRKLYEGFLDVGETPFRLTRIGAGPDGLIAKYKGFNS